MKFREKFIKIYDYGDAWKLRCLFFKREIFKNNMSIHISELGDNFIKNNNRVINNTHYVPTDYKTLISVQGFGWTGSSALIDLMREFDKCCVCGFAEIYSGIHNDNLVKKIINFEIDYYRELKLWNLQDCFDSDDELVNNWNLKRLIKKSKEFSNYKDFFGLDFLKYFNEFLLSIANFNVGFQSISLPLPLMFNGFGENNIAKDDNQNERYGILYSLKQMSKQEFLNKSKKFNQLILKHLNSKEILVLDQFLGCENGYDLDLHSKYLGEDIKQICVYRDPRDQFYTLLHLSGLDYEDDNILQSRRIDRICRSVGDFKDFLLNVANIERYKEYHPNRLMIRFEDLINDYENSITTICDFLGIDKSHHINKGKYFIPEVSRKNIGIYKNYHDQRVMDKIKEELGEYCYE